MLDDRNFLHSYSTEKNARKGKFDVVKQTFVKMKTAYFKILTYMVIVIGGLLFVGILPSVVRVGPVILELVT